MTGQAGTGVGPSTAPPLFELVSSGVQATGFPQGKGFVVRAGSQARAEATPSFTGHNYFALRSSLISEGRLVKTDDLTRLMYTQDVVFDSVSAAAAVTLGRAQSGQAAWKEQSTGQSYSDWRAGLTPGPVFQGLQKEPVFEWPPFFKALAHKLLEFHEVDRHPALIRLLRQAGISVGHDEGEELTVIDPFTFFSLVLKHKTDARVQELFAFIGEKLGISEPAPASLIGVPWSNPMNAWFFPYRSKRKPDDLPTLWALARQAVDGTLEKRTFERALEIQQVGVPKLTQGLFWLNPDAFLPLNGIVVPYLDELGVSGAAEVRTLSDYEQVLEQARDLASGFPALSYGAWVAAQEEGEVILPPDVSTPEVKFRAPPGVPLNQILYGPPGTGKTYSVIDEALKILEPSFASSHSEKNQRDARKARYDELVAEGRVTFMTFHQSFGYEDFIEGLKPVMKGGQLTYDLEDGLFLRAVRQAGGAVGDEEAEGTLRAHVLIIDEINRGNVSKVFGELMTLLEEGKRAGAAEALMVQLPLSKRNLSVPQSLYVIGTMNTADRSLTQLDAALRRRFTFSAVWPDPSLLPDALELDGGTLNLQAFLRSLNERIEERLSRDQMIGHAYLLGVQPTLEQVAGALRNKILPLLEEYFFEDWNSIREVLGDDQKTEEADQFIHVRRRDTGQSERRRYSYNEKAFGRLSAFQGVYSSP
ncbi:DUF4357 domain-containing protein [Deinococcus sp. HMF7620]|uniref:DUF4357 domain-containing protein n=1 Tax=Deinococcus arboris TaxID=2682977 RepID=A0A7C9HS85_9DEIO|nr:DUF4357 domain-containing protein [Deinococcus arboris]MVN87614.1 DUF4357 domain-containing protein [Deinococcus arboris]